MSEVKVNKISPRTNCGTVQLGDSGDTITIPAGATINNQGTATNFGPTGSVSWQTTVKTSGFTATAGEGYFVDTSSGAVSVNLPAGTAGAVVGFKDYLNSFDTNALTLVQNGSDKIGGSTANGSLTTEGIAVTLVFIDSTRGWLVTDSGLQSESPTATFIEATGGTVSTVCTNFKVHTFTGPGTFCVSAVGNAAGSNTVSYLVAGGGGGGGGHNSAGGGAAGGFREGRTTTCSYTVSPLNAPAGLPVSVQGYSIAVGGGGSGGASGSGNGSSGAVSTFSTITSAGGGAGAGQDANGVDGGSGGGGGGGGGPGNSAGGSGNTPPVSPPQGNDGGANVRNSTPAEGGGGGGAGAVGAPGGGPTPAPNRPSAVAGNGGAGVTSSINGTPTARAGGGGGGGNAGTPTGGSGGGGAGGTSGGGTSGVAGTANTGGGGGGSRNATGGAGGSGIVIIRYKFQ